MYAQIQKKAENQTFTQRVQSEAQSSFEDNRNDTLQKKEIQSLADNSPRHERAYQLKAMADTNANATENPAQLQEKSNNTGLPDDLKSGIESLSGYSMDDVQVHYNSDKPAQLNAHAYAQGTDIHVASGQEKHLPHEAWHVVQQKQGRVKPTAQMKGKAKINDDISLEREADVMGAKALQMNASTQTLIQQNLDSSNLVQKYSTHKEYMVSEEKKFAVINHGKRNSQMFVRSMKDVQILQHIKFEEGKKIDINGTEYSEINPKYQSEEKKAEMEKMYCGQFSRHVRGKGETQESGDAPTGRSLYMKISGPASVWENHYAPVIISDGGDRGTFETAVGLDHIFFGIYGQELTQSFAYKTELTGIVLGLENDKLGKGLVDQREAVEKEGGDLTQYNIMIAENEKQKEMARTILSELHDTAISKKQSEETKEFLEKLKVQITKQYNLDAELKKEEKEAREAEEREKKRKEKRNQRILLAVGVTFTMGLILFKLFNKKK